MDLSIIIVNYNTKDLTIDCIKSVLKHTKKITYEVIIVDNASLDDSIKEISKLRKTIKNLKLIENNKNLGFAKANNQGLRRAKGKYSLLLNSDTVIKNNLLHEMIDWMDDHPKVGVSTCALLNKDGSIQGSGGNFPDLFRVFAWMFFLEDIPLLDRLIKPFHPMHTQSPFYKGEVRFKKAHQKDWITGAFFLIRAKATKRTGFLDEDYFMYGEEMELCFRIKKAGWQVWYLPRWSIIHFGGASSTSEFAILSEYTGIKLFYNKHLPVWQLPIIRLFLKGGSFLRIIIFGILKGKEAAKVYAKAFKQA